MAEPDTDFIELDARHGAAAMTEAALRDLRRLGFGALTESDRRLLALLARFDLHLQIGRTLDGQAWIAVAPWELRDGAAGDVFSGVGFAPADAVRSCLGEFAEFQSWLFRPGDVAARRSVEDSARLIDPWSVLGFSGTQRAQSQAPSYDDIPSPATFAGEIDCSEAACLNDSLAAWVPSQLCFGRYAGGWRNDSNGCAAGTTPEHARLAALLELIERDATGIWWYGGCRRPQVDCACLDRPDVSTAIAARRETGRQVTLLDLTHDLRVPVVAAILLDRGGRLLALGVGCKMTLGEAAASAYLEMCQMELSVALVKQRAEHMASEDDRRLLDWLRDVDVARFPHLTPAPDREPAPAREQTFDGIVAQLLSAGLQTYSVDLQRADIGIPAVRLFVPGLCHFKPRLGHARLVKVPKALGWRGADFSARDLNPTPLLI
jgi:ribosomal protein S12 methylthiotransferase accessory factor